MARPRKYASNAERQRAYRLRRKAAKPAPAPAPAPVLPDDHQGAAVCAWAAETLRVPAGHPLAGQPMIVPNFGAAFIGDVFANSESLLCIGRKNAKSAIVAVLLLAHLVGPARKEGFRAGVLSLNRDKAGELLRQIEEIAGASGLEGLQFRRVPYPGRVVSSFGTVEIQSADRGAGHSAGFDLAVIDEIGLLAERDRHIVAGMRSSTSAKGGRFVSLSIHGDGPFVPEIVARQGSPGLAVHHYAADPDRALNDPVAWRQANPGIDAGIKSVDYMKSEAARVLMTPADQPHFVAHDLNLPQSPTRELLIPLSAWRECVVTDLPARAGPCFVGFDLGGTSSMTAAAAYWPAARRLEVYGAFPADPDLQERGRADGVGDRYVQMHDRGEIEIHAGRVTPVSRFLAGFARRLEGERVAAAGADRYRRGEAAQALDEAGVQWPMVWRGQGASTTADGSHDLRAFQRRVLSGDVHSAPSLLMASALRDSEIRYDGSGNPALEKGRQRGRIDACSAAVIAAGLAEAHRSAPRPAPRVRVANPA